MTQEEKLEAAVKALLDAQKNEASGTNAKPAAAPQPKPQPAPQPAPASQPKPQPTPQPAEQPQSGTVYRKPIQAEELAPPHVEYKVEKTKKAAVALGILLGWVGAHDFYLKRNVRGVIKVVLTIAGVFPISVVWSIIDVIRILRGDVYKDAKGEYLT